MQDELQQSKELENILTNQYEEEKTLAKEANEKREKMEQELTQMTENLENQLSKTEKLEKELAELRENQRIIDELEQEINGMRTQQERLTASLTDLSGERSRAQELEEEVQKLRSESSPEIEVLQEELRQTKEQLRRARSQQQIGMNQSDIAQVMIEAQSKAREIVETANQEAKRRIVDAESELSTISQEARNYYRKLESIKYESESVFSELLRKLEKIGDIDRI